MKKRKSSRKDNLVLRDSENKIIEVPVEGSLGILAAGYRGVMLWREKRKQEIEKKVKEKLNTNG